MPLDLTIHLTEVLLLLAAAIGGFRAALGFRDGIRDMTSAVERLQRAQEDHEERLRVVEHRAVLDRRSTFAHD